MLDVELAPMFHLCVIARGPTVLDAIVGIDVGIDVFANLIRQGLIYLLVGTTVATSATLWTRRASTLVRIYIVVAPRSSIEVGAASFGSRALEALMLTSSVVARATGATAVSRPS